tara:strand:- start:207 stop:491 length:285 start_codon:yes stop_codon:yes gene_type:complete
MKITKSKLRQIIREELAKEAMLPPLRGSDENPTVYNPDDPIPTWAMRTLGLTTPPASFDELDAAVEKAMQTATSEKAMTNIFKAEGMLEKVIKA